MKYRAEIDGLRALAVLPVIFFHAGFEFFGGGFVGVDVFFVISGYLITSIIINEMSNGSFSIINFYNRRARRILPALFFVMFVSLPFAWLWLLPGELDTFGQSLISVSLFSSNILFWFESGYFDAAAELKPLLHTWSLGVEEQYYIIFPLFLIFTWKFGIRQIAWFLVFIFILSLFFAQWSTTSSNTSMKIMTGAFFLLPSRAWELIIGVLIALYLNHKGHFKSFYSNQILSMIGGIMIVYSVIAFDKTTPFPSFYTLIPTIGTGLLILSAVPKTFANRVLSFFPFVTIGLISYSAYLWHQPILAFTRHRMIGEISESFLFLLCFLSLVMGYVSWNFIEKPFRSKNKISNKTIFNFSALGMIFFILVGSIFQSNNGFQNRLPEELSGNTERKFNNECNFFDLGDNLFLDNNLSSCMSGKQNIYLIGDSHAQALSFEFRNALNKRGLNLITITDSGCFPFIGASLDPPKKSCESMKIFLDEKVLRSNNNVIIAARWRYHLEGSRYNNGEGGIEKGPSGQVFLSNPNYELFDFIGDAINQLSESSNLFIVNQIPELGFDPIKRKFLLGQEGATTHSYSNYLKANSRVNKLFRNLTNATLIETDKLVCSMNTQRCLSEIDNQLLYVDYDHPSDFFAKMISNEFLESFIAN